MIDWMTLRTPIGHFMDAHIFETFFSYLGTMEIKDCDGEVIRHKVVLDVDKLSTDSIGLFWSLQSDGKEKYLTIGASPAALEYDNNVFGSEDALHCAKLLVSTAQRALQIILPPPSAWQCRRLDITHNYLMQSHVEVKQALRELRKGDGMHQKATVPKGDTVYWGQGSDLVSGKAYDKGSQLEYMIKRNKIKSLSESDIALSKRLLRLELSLKRRWFDRHEHNLSTLTPDLLNTLHHKYFSQFIGTLEVTDMESLLKTLNDVAPTHGQALAAHRTWALIRTIGYENTKGGMPKPTFMRHQKLLLEAGLSKADLHAAMVIPFRQKHLIIQQPVTSWHDLRSAA